MYPLLRGVYKERCLRVSSVRRGNMTRVTLIEPRPLKFFADVQTGKFHTSLDCREYTLPRHAWWAFPYYQQEI